MRLRGMGLDKLDQRSLCRKESARVRKTVSTSSTNRPCVIPADAGISPPGYFQAVEISDQVRDDEGISAVRNRRRIRG